MNGRVASRRRRLGAGLAIAAVAAAIVALLTGGSAAPPATHPGGKASRARSVAPSLGRRFPSPSDTGVPAGWKPARTLTSDMVVHRAGAVIHDVRFADGAKLTIQAKDVTVRDSELQGGWIESDGYPGLVIEDVTIDRPTGDANEGEGVVSYCNYTAIRVKVLDRSEGFRESCARGTTTTIRDSFIRIAPPADCADWHGDGIQGYGGVNLHVTDVTIDFRQTRGCGGTAPFFYPGGAGGSPHGHAHVDGLLVKGGGYSFRMGTPGSVRGLKIVDGSWTYAPIEITDAGCGAISPWDAEIVDVDADWRVTRTVRSVPCR